MKPRRIFIIIALVAAVLPARAAGSDGVHAGFDNGFYLRDAEGLFSLRLNAFAQVRYMFTRSNGQSGRSNFDIALGRVSFSGSAYDPRLTYFLQAETSTLGGSNGVHMIDGWMQYRIAPGLNIRAGRLLLPYSRQFFTHPGELQFADLSGADYAFNLPRSAGAHISGSAGRFSYHLAATNSIRALDGSGEHNIGSGLSSVARVDFDVLRPYGFLETSPRPVYEPQFSIGAAVASNQSVNGSRFQNLSPGDRTKNATLDAGFRWNRVSLQAAGYARWRERDATSGRDRGAYAQGGVFVVPRQWEVAARTSLVAFAPGGRDTLLRQAREYTVGVNRYFYEHHFKIQGDYTRAVVRRDAGSSAGPDHGFRIQGQLLF